MQSGGNGNGTMFERMRGAVIGETTAAPAVRCALVCICMWLLSGAHEHILCQDKCDVERL